MNPARTSGGQEYCNDDTQRSEMPRKFGQVVSETERPREMEPGVSVRAAKKSKSEQGPGELCNEIPETALVGHSQAGDIPMLEIQEALQWMLGSLMKRRSWCEDHIQAAVLSILSISAYKHFNMTGNVRELDRAIEYLDVAVALVRGSQTEWWCLLTNLGCAYSSRFARLGEASDLRSAIEFQTEAVYFTPEGHPDKPRRLSALGVSYDTRFRSLGELSDLNKAIEFKTQAVSLTPEGHPDKPATLSDLGDSYRARFERLGTLSELNKAIELSAQAILLTPDSHPNRARYLDSLGASYWRRFGRLGELLDLAEAIELQAQAVSLTPEGHSDKPVYLSNLGNSYMTRFGRLGELADINKAIVSQALAVSFTSEGRPGKAVYLHNLGNSYWTRFGRLGEMLDLDKAIESQTQAVSLTPEGHSDKPGSLNNLAVSYCTRFERLGELLDLNRAIELQSQAAFLAPEDHPEKPGYLNNLGACYWIRFERLGELPDLNRAIESQAEAVSLVPNGHPDKPVTLTNLGGSYQTQFERLGGLLDMNRAIEFRAQALMLTPQGHPDKAEYLSNLGVSYMVRFGQQRELSDLNKAIDSQEEAILLTPGGHPEKPRYLSNLGSAYVRRFERLGELLDLDKAIESQTQAVSLTPEGHSRKAGYLNNLGISFKTRFERLGKPSDLKSAEEFFSRASQSPTGPPSVRFYACKSWAKLCFDSTMPSPRPAYQSGMSLIPQLVWIGTTINRRYELVVEVSNFASEAASYAILAGEYNLALEWIEAGRSIVWGQLAQLRSPFEELSRHHPKLADELTRVGCQLERAESRSSPPFLPKDITRDLDQEARIHIDLALEWDGLLKEIREIPGYEDFLCSPKAGRLLTAAKVHPIVIVNLHKSRCDALILQPGSDEISHVPLTDFSSKEAILARDQVLSLVRDRRPGPQLNPLGYLHCELDSVWLAVVKPVLDVLGYQRKAPTDELPHLTWCIPGLLSSLPLHAARSRDESCPGTFDLVISSYTPTLSALLSSQSADLSATCGIVAIGQENTPGLNPLPCTTTELAVIHKYSRSECHLQLENDEVTVEGVLDAMDQFSWVHIACHGSQDPHDPMKSAFHLHDGNLTLAAITKQSFTNKGPAFLSACQTATGDKNMPDEAVHLAAGMLMAGYPSVIGTMWSIADEDGPEVADLVYAELLKDGKMDHTKSARALHRAVARLRESVGVENVARWAPFIHIGS